ncbi:hypothetical protein AZO1586I_1803 [Bathymodiolus thermophilus thioautotrophic gill symbiont]|uniref:Uncharacterized protein n=1 Tax=Bathymodiolus thermophilus thioautotrophic gill symbiont TaxID=2360 RepID=A0ABM8M9T1_9GAMM|nr:hypothetical protein [Bathymodiolus thermophilus thioautotrophic gill symbiont]CAB5507264.1 hypothetical protein AZO1586I_1803 [Bathymodiolus thermophilus thioautotrophic gill symbiont]
MISTKKQFHPLGENQRQLNLSLTNQTLCVYENFKLQTIQLTNKPASTFPRFTSDVDLSSDIIF